MRRRAINSMVALFWPVLAINLVGVAIAVSMMLRTQILSVTTGGYKVMNLLYYFVLAGLTTMIELSFAERLFIPLKIKMNIKIEEYTRR